MKEAIDQCTSSSVIMDHLKQRALELEKEIERSQRYTVDRSIFDLYYESAKKRLCNHAPIDKNFLFIMECLDFLEFQDSMKKMRDLDDKLVYALNASVPSPSFRNEINPESSCKELFIKLKENHEKREKAIQNCISSTSSRISELKESGDNKALNKELRLLKSELGVEDIVRDRSLKLYYERCRGFFKPPSLSINN